MMYLTASEQVAVMIRARRLILNPRRFLAEGGVYARGLLGCRRPYDSRLWVRLTARGAIAQALWLQGFPNDTCYPWFYSNETSLQHTFEYANDIDFARMDEWCAAQDHADVLVAFDNAIRKLLQYAVNPDWYWKWLRRLSGPAIRPPKTETSRLALETAFN